MCSAASFDFTFVVMTESFTKAPGCERSASESSAARARTGTDNVAMTNKAVTIFDFKIFPCEQLKHPSLPIKHATFCLLPHRPKKCVTTNIGVHECTAI